MRMVLWNSSGSCDLKMRNSRLSVCPSVLPQRIRKTEKKQISTCSLGPFGLIAILILSLDKRFSSLPLPLSVCPASTMQCLGDPSETLDALVNGLLLLIKKQVQSLSSVLCADSLVTL